MKMSRICEVLFFVNMGVVAWIGYMENGWRGVASHILFNLLCAWVGVAIGYLIYHYVIKRGR